MPTLHEALLTFLQEDRSQLTNRQYELVLTQLVTAIGPGRDVALIRYEDLVDYFARARKRGLKQSTVSGYLSVAKSFFNWCVGRRYIEHSPAAEVRVRKPRREPQQTKAIPPDDLNAIVEIARINSRRDYAMLLFMADTACRVGGLITLTIDNLNLEEGYAKLTEKGGVVMKVTFGDKTRSALADWLRRRPAADHDYVWTGQGPGYKPLTRGGVAAMMHRYSERAELSHRWSPHSIRHAVGHAWSKRGVPVTITQRKLGHSSPAITMNYYYPDDDAYLEQVSRRNSLAALDLPGEDEAQTLRIIKPDASDGQLKNGS